MPERGEGQAAERLDKLVSDLLAGRHLKVKPGDAVERQAIQAAARLAGARDVYPRMSPAFRRRLGRLLEKSEPAPRLTRRGALLGGLGVAMGAALGGLAVGELDRTGFPGAPAQRAATGGPRRQPNATPAPRGVIEPRPELGRWADTGVAFADMVEGQPQKVTAGSVSAFVFRKGEQVIAMSAYCTHLPCELVWRSKVHQLNCPCHNLAFDADGVSLSQGYKLPPLPLVKARVRNGRVEVLGTA